MTHSPPGVFPLFDCSDLGNARRLAEHFAGRIAFVQGVGWCSRSGEEWVSDPVSAHRAAIQLSELVESEAHALHEEIISGLLPRREVETMVSQRSERWRWIGKCQSHARMRAALKIASVLPEFNREEEPC